MDKGISATLVLAPFSEAAAAMVRARASRPADVVSELEGRGRSYHLRLEWDEDLLPSGVEAQRVLLDVAEHLDLPSAVLVLVEWSAKSWEVKVSKASHARRLHLSFATARLTIRTAELQDLASSSASKLLPKLKKKQFASDQHIQKK